MKYLEEGTIFSNIQNKYNNEINQTKSLKQSNGNISSSRSTSPHKSFLQKSYILPIEKPLKPIEKPLKSPKRLVCTNAAANRLYQLHTQQRASDKNQTNNKQSNTNLNNNKNIYLLSEMVNVYNGFIHKFSNENSSIRAYKTIGHTTLSFASIISMKNRPLLDRKVISESNQRKKERKNKQQEQKRKRKNNQLQKRRDKLNEETMDPPLTIEIYNVPQHNDSVSNKEPVKEKIDHDVKVEILRTLSVSEEGRLSSESLESLKSIDYIKIEDIINEYLITPSMPEVPSRYEMDEDHLNSLNHLYDAYNYFNNLNLKQFVAWIPLNDNKGCLSASSVLAKKHAPLVLKKTITHPKRVSSLYANYIHNDIKDNLVNDTDDKESEPKEKKKLKKEENQKKPKENIIKESIKDKKQESEEKQSIPTNDKIESTNTNKPKSLHSKVVENLETNKKSKKNEDVKESNKKSSKNKEIKPKENKNKIETRKKTKQQENKNESKLKPTINKPNKSNENKIETKIKPKAQENEIENKSREIIQENKNELKNNPIENTNTHEKKNKTKETKGKNQKPSKIPILPSSNIDPCNIKIGNHKNVPLELIRNKYSNIPTLGKFEFPFYHMYDAFETYGKPLLRAPRAWRQLKKNVVSIASIYSYDNRP
eukprot:jgi/Orpsp1_1/1183787/evm.model.c7180000086721.1